MKQINNLDNRASNKARRIIAHPQGSHVENVVYEALVLAILGALSGSSRELSRSVSRGFCLSNWSPTAFGVRPSAYGVRAY